MDSDSTLVNNSSAPSSGSCTFVVGQVIDNKFEILEILGCGGMGAVYRAKHLLLNIEVALKTLDAERLGDATSSRRFRTEAKAAFSLKHPNVVKVHDFGALETGQPYLVMELVKGRSLQSLIKERGRLALPQIASIFAQICSGLAHAHYQQIIHRDIKPANIMLVDDTPLSEEGSVKILDFGIAKIVGSACGEMQTLTQTGEIFGSPFYMSPEQCSGAAIDQRSDVYSLGCVLFEALTGTPPFAGSNALRTMMLHVNNSAPPLREAALGAEFPLPLEHVVSKMLAKEPSARYADMSLVARDIFVACGACEQEFKISNVQTSPANQNMQFSAKEKISLTYVQLGLTIAATVFISVLGTLMLDKYTGKSESVSAKNSRHERTAAAEQPVSGLGAPTIDDATAIRDKFTEAKVIFSRVAQIKAVPNQSRTRQTIVFPQIAMGDLTFFDHAQSRKLKAKGPVDLPLGAVWLNVEVDLFPQLLSNADIFSKLDPSFVKVFSFVGPDLETSAISQTPELLALNNQMITDMLKIMTNWPFLDNVIIANQEISSTMMDHVDKMAALERFGFNEVTFRPDSLRGHSTFRRIKELVVQNIDPKEVFSAAAGSDSIQIVVIDCNVTAADIATIGSCKHLRTVTFARASVPDDIARAVDRLSQVQEITTRHCALSKKSLDYLSRHWEAVPLSADEVGKYFRLHRR